MDIGEAAAIFVDRRNDDKYCKKKKSKPPSGKVNIDKVKGGNPNPYDLRKNMLAAGKRAPIPPNKISGFWDLEDCNTSTFPYQTHHLIPKKHLPKHIVCAWLTDSPKKPHPKYVLEADTNFDTDHHKNGYFMPFASNTYQWKKGTDSRDNICDKMMDRTRIQLHQGQHTKEDFLADEEIVTKGYLTMVNSFLNMIYSGAQRHVNFCEVCKDQGSGKIKVQPLESIVRQTYMVCNLLKGLIKGNRIFVSRRAAQYHKRRHL